jgi:hypothetical protein
MKILILIGRLLLLEIGYALMLSNDIYIFIDE